jgi:hypothetical protein
MRGVPTLLRARPDLDSNGLGAPTMWTEPEPKGSPSP